MLKKFVTLASLVLTLSSATVRLPGQTPGNDAFVVGVLRTDGVIVPFAQYANQKWTNPWHSPQPDAQPDEPETIADLPKPWFESLVKPPAEWYLPAASGEATAIKISKIVEVDSHCQRVWGLLSDYPDAKQAEKNTCVGNVGAVLSEKKQARAMEELTNASPHRKQMMTFIGPEFERAENVELSATPDQQYSSQLPPAEERSKIPLSILRLYRIHLADDGQLLFYFEAGKEYPKPRQSNDSGCNNLSLLSGWVFQDPKGKLALLDSTLELTDCDMKEGGRILPFAILQFEGKTLAIIEEIGYEGEAYIVLEIRQDGVQRVVETYAGGC